MQARIPRVWTPASPEVDWDSQLGTQSDFVLLPQKRQMVSRGLPNNFTRLSSGVIVPKPTGISFAAAGGTSDGWATANNFDGLSGATSLSLFVVMHVASTSGAVLGRWSTPANFGGLLLTFESNCLATVVAETNDLPLKGYAKRTGTLSPGVIVYGMTWAATSSQDNYINGTLNNGSVWFSGTPSVIQTVSEKLYLNRHGDSASGPGNSSIAFAAIGINKAWSADTHRQWARNYRSVFKPRRIWVPVSAAGGGVVIDCTPGDAVASGPLAQIDQARQISATPGDATAAGVTAQIDQARIIAATPGNAVADGVTAKIDQARRIDATPGNAVAAGVDAQIITTGAVVIDCTPGNAVADGVTAQINQARLILATPGNAVAAGVDALISTANNVVINATPGNAVAAGVTATLISNVRIDATPGAAVADGVTASIISGGEVAPTAAGWYDDDAPKRKKRFVAEVDGKLLVFGSAQAAAKALNNRKADPEAAEQAKSPETPKPDVEVDLPAVAAFAERTGQTTDYKTALNNKHLESILKLFSDMEDEDDVEMLLMSL